MPPLLQQALALHNAGRFEEALAAYRRVLAAEPRNADAWHYLGVLLAQRGDHQGAIAAIGKALALDDKVPLAHFHLAESFRLIERHDEALASYDRAIALKPDFAPAHGRRAEVLLELRRPDEALQASEAALALAPQLAEAHDLRGNALLRLGRKEEALQAFDHAIAQQPDYAPAHNDRGQALYQLGRLEEALGAFRKAAAIAPDFYEALNNQGNVLSELECQQEALAAFRRALALKPEKAAAHYNIALLFIAMNRLREARAALDQAVSLDPLYGEAWFNRARVHDDLGQDEQALADSDRALEVKPELGLAASKSFFARARLCDWKDRAARRDDLKRRCLEGQMLDVFPLLGAFDDPALHLTAAKNMAKTVTAPRRFATRAPVHERLRVAYLSADFHEHPVAHQIVELIERHDRARFEVFGVCLHDGPDSAIRQRLKAAFEHFLESGGRSDAETARLLAEAEIDIAVDLNGYTTASRPRIFAMRAAPIAVNYLGYPGTLGADYLDYILADAMVIPPDAEGFYSERVVRLPHCFMPSDSAERDGALPTRQEAGLPPKGFVFCGFNAAYKITPEVFDLWMRLLQAVDNSVLWLNLQQPRVQNNLRAEAKRRGIDPERLVFAERKEARRDHLARLALADLFLDTFPYGAHSTASDMLRADVPVVTVLGKSFAARVGASLLTALGVPELIAESLDGYEALALDLARAPERLAALREKLNRNRAGLFDMASLCRDIETAYDTMWRRQAAGQTPAAFIVAP